MRKPCRKDLEEHSTDGDNWLTILGEKPHKVQFSPTLSHKIHSRWIKELSVKNEDTQKIRKDYREILI